MSDSSDVLPEPDGPVRATNSPGSMLRETSHTATTGPGWTRPRPSVTTRAPTGAGRSAVDTHRVIEVDAALVRDPDDHAQGQREADGPPRPDEGAVAHAALEGVRRVAAGPGPRARRVGVGLRARVARGHDLAVVEELVGGGGAHRLARARQAGDGDRPELVGLGMVAGGLELRHG